MLTILLTVLPVFLILGAGYVAAKTNYVSASVSEALNSFTIKVAIPVLLFRALYNLDLSQAFQWEMLLGFYIGGITCFIIAIILARKFWNRRPGESIAVGFCALFSNLVLLGIAIANRAYGESVMDGVFSIISLHVVSMYLIGMVTMELTRRDGKSLGETVRAAVISLAKNPLLIGTALGAFFSIANIPLPEFTHASINMIADAGIPAALFGLGITITRYKLKAELGEALMVSTLMLFVHPTIALLITHYGFALAHEQVRAAVILASMPPGLNIYIFANMYKRAEALAASAIILATCLSIFTISFWIWLLEQVLV